MTTIILTIILVAIIMLVMAVGFIFRGRCLRGSCGGNPVIGPDGEEITCPTCPRRQHTDEAQGETAHTP